MTPWAYERIGEPGKVPMPDIRGPIAVIDPEDSGQGVQPMEPEDVDGWLLWDGYALIDYAGECVAVMLDPPTVQRPADMVPDIDTAPLSDSATTTLGRGRSSGPRKSSSPGWTSSAPGRITGSGIRTRAWTSRPLPIPCGTGSSG